VVLHRSSHERSYSTLSPVSTGMDVLSLGRYTTWVCNQDTRWTQPCMRPSGVAKSSISLNWLGVKAGLHFRRVAGNIVWSHMANEFPHRWSMFANCYTPFTLLTLLSEQTESPPWTDRSVAFARCMRARGKGSSPGRVDGSSRAMLTTARPSCINLLTCNPRLGSSGWHHTEHVLRTSVCSLHRLNA